MRIVINQLPPEECSPNARCHWSKKYRAGRAYQDAVFLHCIDARNRIPDWTPYKKAIMDIDFYYDCERRRDTDNLLAMFKPGLDAIT